MHSLPNLTDIGTRTPDGGTDVFLRPLWFRLRRQRQTHGYGLSQHKDMGTQTKDGGTDVDATPIMVKVTQTQNLMCIYSPNPWTSVHRHIRGFMCVCVFKYYWNEPIYKFHSHLDLRMLLLSFDIGLTSSQVVISLQFLEQCRHTRKLGRGRDIHRFEQQADMPSGLWPPEDSLRCL